MTQLKKTKEDKQKRKLYLKTNKKYRKELKELLKNYGPWDNYVGCFLDIQIRHWIDYYTLGYNVVAKEVKDTPEFNQPNRPTRLEIALEMKTLYDRYCDMTLSNFKREDGSIDVDKFNEAYRKAKREFFEYYMKYADDMWD